jgi:5-epi-alpha-selinene synthase
MEPVAGPAEIVSKVSAPTFNLYCPFEPALNPNAEAAHDASVDWARRLGLVSSDAEVRYLDRSRIGWLVARAFPGAPLDELQLAADWTTLFCVLDDRTEADGLAPMRLAAFLARLLDVFKSGKLHHDDDPLAHAFLDLRRRLDRCAPAGWVASFADRLEEIFVGFSWEAINRSKRIKPDLDAYRTIRETTVGLYPQFALTRLTDGICLPPEVLEHPIVERLHSAASRCVGWANDIFTHEKELEQGEVNNLVLALMDNEALPLEAAVARACEEHDAEVRRFLELERALPSFGAADGEVRRYLGILRSFIRGHLDWSRETGRYRPSAVEEAPRAAAIC